MDYTYATIIVLAANQAAAQLEYPAYFATPASADGNLPATAYFTAGPFGNVELDAIVNDVNWPHWVYFGEDWQGALAKEGLVMITAPTVQPVAESV